MWRVHGCWPLAERLAASNFLGASSCTGFPVLPGLFLFQCRFLAPEVGMSQATGRILVVDDQAETREALQKILGAEGYQVDHASVIAAAIECLGKQTYSLVLCDLRLGTEDGLVGLEHVRASKLPK